MPVYHDGNYWRVEGTGARHATKKEATAQLRAIKARQRAATQKKAKTRR